MAESTSSVAPVDEDINEPMSQDIFSDCEVQDSGPSNMDECQYDFINLYQQLRIFMNINITVSSFKACPDELNEPQWADDTPEWKGVSMDEIYRGLGLFGYQQQPPIRPSEHHTVLFQVDIKYVTFIF